MKDYLEIKFWQLAKHIIKKSYGADCEIYCDSCVSCKAQKMNEWIDEHIELIKYFK